MKPFRNSMAAFIFLLSAQLSVSAQSDYARHQASSYLKAGVSSLNTSKEAAIDPPVNPLATARFSGLFPQAEDAKWSSREGDSFVSFLSNGQKSTAAFNAKGALTYVITACNLAQLPGELVQIITTEYIGYQLFYAKEVKAHGNIAYHAVLEGEKDFVTLKYTSDGVEETKQVRK